MVGRQFNSEQWCEINSQRFFGYFGLAIGATFGGIFSDFWWIMAAPSAVFAAVYAIKVWRHMSAH